MREMFDKKRCGGNGGFFWGGAFIVVGLIFLLERMGIIPPIQIHLFWPVILIIVGISHLVQPGRRAMGAMWILIGGLFQLQQLGVGHLSWGEIWPIALIAGGVLMMWGSLERRNVPLPNLDPRTSFNETVVFGGIERRITTRNFQGGRVLTVFGGVELDLREAEIEGNEAVVQIDAIFGGCEIRVPDHWHVLSAGNGMFGGYSDKSRQSPPDSASATERKTLILRGTVVFGGVEIKN